MRTQNENPVKPIETKPNPRKNQSVDPRRNNDEPKQNQQEEKRYDTLKSPEPNAPKSEVRNAAQSGPSETDPRINTDVTK